jgi:hypothetical protein
VLKNSEEFLRKPSATRTQSGRDVGHEAGEALAIDCAARYSPTLKSAALGLHGTRTRMPASFLQVLADFAHAGQDRPGPFDLDHCENDAALSARGGAQRSEIWRKSSSRARDTTAALIHRPQAHPWPVCRRQRQPVRPLHFWRASQVRTSVSFRAAASDRRPTIRPML